MRGHFLRVLERAAVGEIGGDPGGTKRVAADRRRNTGRRGWVRLQEKGGKEHEVPCHHTLERYLDEYIAAACIAAEPDAPLFQSTGRKTGQAQAMWQQYVCGMIQRRAKAAGIKTKIGNHTFRATGITAYLANGGALEHAAGNGCTRSPRTTKLYDRTRERLTQDEVERIRL